jgi:hypothetical protein
LAVLPIVLFQQLDQSGDRFVSVGTDLAKGSPRPLTHELIVAREGLKQRPDCGLAHAAQRVHDVGGNEDVPLVLLESLTERRDGVLGLRADVGQGVGGLGPDVFVLVCERRAEDRDHGFRIRAELPQGAGGIGPSDGTRVLVLEGCNEGRRSRFGRRADLPEGAGSAALHDLVFRATGKNVGASL